MRDPLLYHAIILRLVAFHICNRKRFVHAKSYLSLPSTPHTPHLPPHPITAPRLQSLRYYSQVPLAARTIHNTPMIMERKTVKIRNNVQIPMPARRVTSPIICLKNTSHSSIAYVAAAHPTTPTSNQRLPPAAATTIPNKSQEFKPTNKRAAVHPITLVSSPLTKSLPMT